MAQYIEHTPMKTFGYYRRLMALMVALAVVQTAVHRQATMDYMEQPQALWHKKHLVLQILLQIKQDIIYVILLLKTVGMVDRAEQLK